MTWIINISIKFITITDKLSNRFKFYFTYVNKVVELFRE